MRFGPIPLAEAEGATLAHSLALPKGRVRKGTTLSRTDIERLSKAGHETVVAIRLDPEDVPEDEAAECLAHALAAPGLVPGTPGTGRCSLFAETDGLLVVDKEKVDALNAVDEAITLATLPAFERVPAGQMAATVKIITFAVPKTKLDRTIDAIGGESPIRLAPFMPLRALLIQTQRPGDKESLLAKTVEATRTRLATLGGTLGGETRCEHEESALAKSLRDAAAQSPDVILVMGSSAIVDRRDVVPAAIIEAGGMIEHFGMPVDPGNLTLLASLGGIPVLGLPGSARSPRLHGFDWILERIAAGIPVRGSDIAGMGVGGLLKEVPGRPMPRLEAAPRPGPAQQAARRVHALILAAGQSRRMGRRNKLLAEVGGVPLVRRVAEAVLQASVCGVTVVTGHEADAVRDILAPLDVAFVHNPDYAEGLSTSLRSGVAALPRDADAAIVCLGDMPAIETGLIDALIAAYDPGHGKTICVPVKDGKRGNPVLWGRDHFRALMGVSGDVGARHLIGENAEAVAEVDAQDEAIFLDLDTPDALDAYRRSSG